MLVKSLPELKSQLTSPLPPIIGVVGKESYDREQALQLLLHKSLEGKNRAFALKTFSADSLQMRRLMDELETSSLFAERFTVVLQDGENLKAAENEPLLKYAENPNPLCTFILVAESLPPQSKLLKQIKEQGLLVQFPTLKPYEKKKLLVAEALNLAKKLGKELPLPLADQLASTYADAHLLQQELEKIACYLGDRKAITPQDLIALGMTPPKQEVWHLAEAIFQGKEAQALFQLKALLLREELIPLLALLRLQVQIGYTISSLLEAGSEPSQVTSFYPHLTGSILTTWCQTARKYGTSKFKRALIMVADADFDARNSAADDDLIAERLVAKLVTL